MATVFVVNCSARGCVENGASSFSFFTARSDPASASLCAAPARVGFATPSRAVVTDKRAQSSYLRVVVSLMADSFLRDLRVKGAISRARRRWPSASRLRKRTREDFDLFTPAGIPHGVELLL